MRPAELELKRARAVLIPPPAVGGRADFFGVDSEQFLRAAAAARASERSGPGHGATKRARTLPARSARPPHPSRAPIPTPTHARRRLSHVLRLTESMIATFMARPRAVGYSCAPRTLHECAARHAEVILGLCPYACRMFCTVFVLRARACTRGLANVRSAIDHVWQRMLFETKQITFKTQD